MLSYTDLHVTSNFSFLRGASHPEELVQEAAALGHACIAITDHNTLAGVVRAHVEAKKTGIRLIIGCHLVLQDGPDLLAYPTDKEAYARLSTMLSEGNLRTEKGQCLLYKKDVYQYKKGMKFIVIPPYQLNDQFDFDTGFKNDLWEYSQHLGSNLYLAMTRSYQAYDDKNFIAWHNCLKIVKCHW
ncbi:PHP domain-containing protein [Niabella defluvii]|nr:PHP domain-containing protein [Niabella sp. I65]